MTCSFHKYGDGFFPGTGDVAEVGKGDIYHLCSARPRPGRVPAPDAPWLGVHVLCCLWF
jgi:hypothetical protein